MMPCQKHKQTNYQIINHKIQLKNWINNFNNKQIRQNQHLNKEIYQILINFMLTQISKKILHNMKEITNNKKI